MRPVLVVDQGLTGAERAEVDVAAAEAALVVRTVAFHSVSRSGFKGPRPTGEVLLELLPEPATADAVIFVAPNEQLLSNHVAVLAGALQRDPDAHCAATAAILHTKGTPVHGVHEILNFADDGSARHAGFARFIFRVSAIPADVGIALCHLDVRPIAALVGSHEVLQLMPATVSVDVEHAFPPRTPFPGTEVAVIRDYSAAALRPRYGFGPVPVLAGGAVVPQPTMTLRQVAIRFMNVRWLRKQWRAIREQGPRTRWQLLLRRLGLQ
jgi:hypothetical protein